MIIENNIKALYIHIPFCSSICSYCDFCKMFYTDKLVEKYLLALKEEVKKNYKNDILKTIYIGGGTPSCLSIEELKKLFEIVSLLKLDNEYEFTIEVNINDITEEKLRLFKKNKVNRLSIGIETINEKFFDFLNRKTDLFEAMEKVNIAKKYFDNINVDLMYAFPFESLEDLKKDLDFVCGISPNHISIYSLIIEEHTKLYVDNIEPIDEELDAKMYYFIIDYLKDKGYFHYEISNFCKPGYESKHNLTYWNNERYYGFGLGASGYIDNYRYTNTRSLNKYIEGKLLYIKEELTKEINMENELIFGLRKISGISRSLFFNKYSFEIEQIFDIIDLVNKRVLNIEGDYIFIPEDKLYTSNSILVNFIGGSSNGDK